MGQHSHYTGPRRRRERERTWKNIWRDDSWTEIILSFLRLHPSTAFPTLVDYNGHSISSKGFLPIVVDIMVIWVKFTHSHKIWKTQQWPQDWKRSVFIPIPKKGNAKECSNYCTIALISHSSKIMLKILQARLQQYVNCELPDVQAGFRKGRGTRDQIANIRRIIKKVREFQKKSTSALLTMPKPLTVWITRNCGKFWKRWEYQTTWPASWEICMQVKKQQLELDIEKQTGSKLGKGVCQGCIL